MQRITGVGGGTNHATVRLFTAAVAAPLQRCNKDTHCRKYLAAECLISSWSANRIHVHSVLRSTSVSSRKNLKTREPIGRFPPVRTVVSIPVAFFFYFFFYDCAAAKLKNHVFVFSLKLPLLMASIRKYFGFSAATVLHSLSEAAN